MCVAQNESVKECVRCERECVTLMRVRKRVSRIVCECVNKRGTKCVTVNESVRECVWHRMKV